MPFTIGEKVGPYQILDIIGQGGMATVYKAFHPNLDRYVAIKVLHPALKQDADFLGRFQREAKLVAKLEHPNIVAVYDFNNHNGNPYLVMRMVEGQTLKTRLKSGPLTLVQIAQIVKSVGSALEYAHGEGILHRDIKPSNIILSEEGKIYLTDFGLARMIQSKESTLSREMIIGTPQYISPEQAIGESTLNTGTDIYSLGVVIYELIVGKVPFNADTPYAIVHDHIYTPLPAPRDVNPDVPEPIERFLFRVLAKKREDRYETVEATVNAFLTAVEHADAGMMHTPVAIPGTRRGRRERPPTKPLKPAEPLLEEEDITLVAPQVSSSDATQFPVHTQAKFREGLARRRRRLTIWPTVGIVLLVAVLLLGGLQLGRIAYEEYQNIFPSTQNDGSRLNGSHFLVGLPDTHCDHPYPYSSGIL
jgi:serine/threonine protein kinase